MLKKLHQASGDWKSKLPSVKLLHIAKKRRGCPLFLDSMTTRSGSGGLGVEVLRL